MGAADLAYNIGLLGHTDQGGRGDGVQVMVEDGYAYVGHMFSNGVTVLDVRDPRDPLPVTYLPAAPGTWNLHLQLAEGLLLVVDAVNLFAAAAFADESAYYGRSIGEVLAARPPAEYSAGMRVYDLADPAAPRQIGFMAVDGFGLHRIWYVGGRWVLCLGAAARVQRLCAGHHRPGRPDPAEHRRHLVVAGHAAGRG